MTHPTCEFKLAPLQSLPKLALLSLVMLFATLQVGCSILSNKAKNEVLPTRDVKDSRLNQQDTASVEKQRVSNPQAREIRFDGNELVLGGGNCQSIPVKQLREMTDDLRARKRYRSARENLRLHRRAASRWVMESFASSNDKKLRWVAKSLDQNTNVDLHSELLDAASANAQAATNFDTARRVCLESIGRGVVEEKAMSSLSKTAGLVDATLATLESERLLAMAEIVSGDTSAASERLIRAAKLAANKGAVDQSSQLWLLASETCLRDEAIDASASAWNRAVRAQLNAMTQQNRGEAGLPPMDTVFWEQADRLRPRGTEFPQEVALAVNPWKLRIGLGGDHELKTAASLWSAVAAYQLTMGQSHLATLSIKRAEVDASEAAKPWLQIALARSMAAQNQIPVATTILGPLTSNRDADVRAASLAALGSIKIQQGAYKQGSNFLVQSLNIDEAAKWQGRLAAEADLANVRLIVGNLDEALDATHSVQHKLALKGRWQSLVRSLENEAAMLEIEKGRASDVEKIRNRIAELEGKSA